MNTRHHWYRPSIDTFGPRVDDNSLLAGAGKQLNGFLAGDRSHFDLPTAAHGDDLQRRIWDRLSVIPYGDTVTYGELADELADGTTTRQIGAAVGRNPLSIVVPCHRVVGKDGTADIRAARLF